MNIYSIPKKQRHRRLLALLGREQIHTQERLRRRLAAMGIRVTQATLSRDIKELGLARTPEGYKVVAAAEHSSILSEMECTGCSASSCTSCQA